MARFRFYTLDVFTVRRFGGNPLAVAGCRRPGRRAHAGHRRRVHLSETAFVLPPVKAGRDRRRIRIFTPQAELPFAGHPTVGTGFLLAKLGVVEMNASNPAMVLEEGVGDVTVRVRAGGSSVPFSSVPLCLRGEICPWGVWLPGSFE